MATAQQVEVLLAGVRDSSGQPLASGKVYTYEPGTTTPKTTWTDSTQLSAAANPVILDSNGRAQIYAEGSYKFVVQTSAGAAVYTWDNLFFNYSGGAFAAYTPTLSILTGTFTSTSIGLARFFHNPITDIVHVHFRFSGTVASNSAGIGSAGIRMTLPSGHGTKAWGTNPHGTFYFDNAAGTTYDVGIIEFPSNDSFVTFYRPAYAAWGNGVALLSGEFFYEASA